MEIFCMDVKVLQKLFFRFMDDSKYSSMIWKCNEREYINRISCFEKDMWKLKGALSLPVLPK